MESNVVLPKRLKCDNQFVRRQNLSKCQDCKREITGNINVIPYLKTGKIINKIKENLCFHHVDEMQDFLNLHLNTPIVNLW